MQRDIITALHESFECCMSELIPYTELAREFFELPDVESSQVDAETDVESLQEKLSSLTEEQNVAKGIKDTQNMSIFRADFRSVLDSETIRCTVFSHSAPRVLHPPPQSNFIQPSTLQHIHSLPKSTLLSLHILGSKINPSMGTLSGVAMAEWSCH